MSEDGNNGQDPGGWQPRNLVIAGVVLLLVVAGSCYMMSRPTPATQTKTTCEDLSTPCTAREQYLVLDAKVKAGALVTREQLRAEVAAEVEAVANAKVVTGQAEFERARYHELQEELKKRLAQPAPAAHPPSPTAQTGDPICAPFRGRAREVCERL